MQGQDSRIANNVNINRFFVRIFCNSCYPVEFGRKYYVCPFKGKSKALLAAY